MLDSLNEKMTTTWMERSERAMDYVERRLNEAGAPVPELPESSLVMTLEVITREQVSADGSVISLVFAAPDGSELPAWYPGSHLDLMLPSGRQRQYSLCGDPADRHSYRIAVRRIEENRGGQGGSREVQDALAVGDTITVRGPRNAFPFAPEGHLNTGRRRLRFIVGGIGITPILPMAELAQRMGLDWSMIYVGASAPSLAFTERIAALGDRVSILTDEVDGVPSVETLLPEIDLDLAVYCCGPVPLLDAVAERVRLVPGVEMHFERFSAPPVKDGRPFQVQLGIGGPLIDVAADESMLTAVLRARPQTVYSCRQGFCATCKIRTISGEVDHRDNILTAAERESGDVLQCVSRAEGTLVLER